MAKKSVKDTTKIGKEKKVAKVTKKVVVSKSSANKANITTEKPVKKSTTGKIVEELKKNVKKQLDKIDKNLTELGKLMHLVDDKPEEKPKRKYVKKADKEAALKVVVPSKKVNVDISKNKPTSVKSILISLPKPETGKSPYIDLANQFKIKLDWRPFTHVEMVKSKDFRLQKVYLDQYNHIIFMSKTSIEQYFRMAEEMRIKVSEDNKYFCINEAIALYLQKFIHYRKRKVFFGDGKLPKLMEVIFKNKDKIGEVTYLIPSSETKDKQLTDTLKHHKIDYKEAILYRTAASDLSDLKNVKYDMLVFFNSSAIDSLYSNFPDFVQNKTRLAIYGNTTAEAVMSKKLRIDIFSPTPENPSMVDAIKKYIEIGNKK